MRFQAQPVQATKGKPPAKLSQEKERYFVCLDGEGTGNGRSHRYVLLGCGDRQYENPAEITWKEAFEFLYDRFMEDQEATYCGFFLGYDFTQILKSLPKERAWMLLSTEGQALRKRKRSGKNPVPFPVRHEGWEFDILGTRRLKIRPSGQSKWMWINDAGPFFQTSLLNVIDPTKWRNPVVTESEYELVAAGKGNRASARLDDEMRGYNRLENNILSRVLTQLDEGLREIGVRLKNNQWFGPGQAAQEWLKLTDLPKREQSQVPPEIQEIASRTYYGGWFEIMMHGHVPNVTWEYDINSAYPFVMSGFPCLEHGSWSQGRGKLPKLPAGSVTMIHAEVWGNNPYIGAMLHRTKHGGILRPWHTKGWYWAHELDAAIRANLVQSYKGEEWYSYSRCDCNPPLSGLQDLYAKRQSAGKDTPLGIAAKLIYNSCYGKFAQSEGNPIFGNPIYASLTTSGCRTIILDAIASHPKGAQDVAMVATDGIYFRSPHPDLAISNSLGSWSSSEKRNLCLFKPGVYWDDKAREAIEKGDSPSFKARGVNARYFSRAIKDIDRQFREIDGIWPRRGEWPKVKFELDFSMVTAIQALQRGKWETAGRVRSDQKVTQDSDPWEKRHSKGWEDGVLRSEPYRIGAYGLESIPYDKTFGYDWEHEDEGITPDGTCWDLVREAVLR